MRPLTTLLVGLLALSACATETTPPPAEPLTIRTLALSNGPDRQLPTLIYQPNKPGKLPLILFIHGYTRRPEDHDLLFKQWAAAGFIVAAPTMSRTARGSTPLDVEDLVNQPADASVVLTAVLSELADKVDTTRIAAGGHSLGGMTTVGLFTRFRDQRLKAGVVLAGSARTVGAEYAGSQANLLFVHGRLDNVVTFEQGMTAYEPLKWPKALLDLPAGNHLLPYLGGTEDFDLVVKVSTDYLLWTLNADQAARGRLDGVAGLTITG